MLGLRLPAMAVRRARGLVPCNDRMVDHPDPSCRQRMDQILQVLRDSGKPYMRCMAIAEARGGKSFYPDTYQLLVGLESSHEVERVPPEEMLKTTTTSDGRQFEFLEQGVGWRALDTSEREAQLHSELLTLSRRLRAQAAFQTLRRGHG